MADVLWNLENVIQPGDFVNRLDDVSLEVCHGGTAVIGYSGAGKTSLLNLLAQMFHRSLGYTLLYVYLFHGILDL